MCAGTGDPWVGSVNPGKERLLLLWHMFREVFGNYLRRIREFASVDQCTVSKRLYVPSHDVQTRAALNTYLVAMLFTATWNSGWPDPSGEVKGKHDKLF